MKYFSIKNLKINVFLLSAFWLMLGGVLTFSAAAQNLPKEIRGYKVYKTKISVKNQTEITDENIKSKDAPETVIKVGDPRIADVSLAGVTLEISAEISGLPESGTIDFLTFNDFRVNGLSVEIAEYRESFEIVKNQNLKLSKPIKIFLSTSQTLRGAAREIKNSQSEWQVTGRVFVFGRFKKSIFKFKRVVPVEISIKIKNPLK